MRTAKSMSVKLPAGLDAQLAAAASARGETKSAMVRRAVGALLAGRRQPARARSFLALARDLSGCVAGPADLSSSKRRLRGYGR